MTVPEKIFALWSGDAGALALVPAARFKFAGIYQNVALPYVFFFPVVLQRYRTINQGAIGALEYGTWQFSIFDTSTSGADTIFRKLISVLDGPKGGFNFFFQTARFVDERLDIGSIHLAVDFFVTAN